MLLQEVSHTRPFGGLGLTLTLLIGGVAILGTPDGDVLATSHYTIEGVEAHGADIFHKQTHKGSCPATTASR